MEKDKMVDKNIEVAADNGSLENIRIKDVCLGNLGGKLRVLHYDLNAFAELDRLYGSTDELNKAMTNPRLSDVRRLLWAGLIHDQAVLDEITGEPVKYLLTMHEVGTWLNTENMKDTMEMIQKAMSQAAGDQSSPSTPTGTKAAEVIASGAAEVMPFQK